MTEPPALDPNAIQQYWPGHWLVPSIPRLQFQLAPPMEQSDEYSKVQLQLEQLPYCLGATSFALLELHRTTRVTVARLLPGGEPAGVIHVISPDLRDRLAFLVDSVLEAARRTQNALLPYLSRGLRLSLPSGLGDLVADLQKAKISLPVGIRDVLIEYWEKHGLRLKQYRDVSQHHAVISSDVRLFRGSDGSPGIYFVLPRNPEEKSASKLDYEEPSIHVLSYLTAEFFNLMRVCNICCSELVDTSKPNTHLYGRPLKSAIRMGQLQGVRVSTLESLYAELRKRVPSMKPPLGL